ncbi:hypothetical protein EBU58_11875, partial [bacterium]|nr:hypothetical protein [bacterium]
MTTWYSAETRLRAARATVAGLLVACAASVGVAELPEPLLTAIMPLGGRQGESVEVTVSGADLDDATDMVFSHPGISAVPVMTEATEFDPEPRPVAGKMLVTIAADVPPGLYDAAVIGRFGVSSPRRFVVGRWPEFRKTAAIASAEQAMSLPVDAVVNAS